MMTIKVYEVNRAGTTRVVRPQAEVVPLETAEESSAYPACECPRHRPAGRDASYQSLLGHTMECATCRAGAACPTATRLGRAWRVDR